MASVVVQVLDKFEIARQILTITSDNAGSNGTLVAGVNNAIVKLTTQLNRSGTLQRPIIWVPCLAHVVQLLLGDLLTSVRINPTNEQVQRNWEIENNTKLLKAIQGKTEAEKRANTMPFTLAKVRKVSGSISGGISSRTLSLARL